MKKRGMTLLSVVLLLALWQGVAMYVGQPALVPDISALLKTLGALVVSAGFYSSAGATVLRGMAGMCLSFVGAVLFAILFARVKWLYELFRPLLTVMRSVPVVSFILLALIFLHTEGIPLLIGFLTMFPLLTENLTKGVCNVRPGLSRMGRQFRLGMRNRWALIYYPQLRPFLYSGLASAAGFGWRAVIMGEVLALCSHGIGSEMKRAQSFIAVSELISWTIVAILISYLTDKAIGWLSEQSFAVRYAPPGKLRHATPPLADGTMPSIVFSHAGYKYGITDFSCTFASGKIYGISGSSGAGKTTLLNLVNGTLQPVAGQVSVDRSQGIAYVFQETELLPELDITDNVALPLARTHTREEARREGLAMLAETGLAEWADRRPDALSYGQQQRVAIARALVFPVPCLLMDEPFKGVDEATAARIIRFIRERQRQTGQTILFTSHHPEELNRLADEVHRL